MRSRCDFWRLGVAAVAVASALAVLGLPSAASAATRTAPQSVSSTCTTSRPHSGTILYSGIRGGLGRITIKNHLSQDSAVVLVRGKSKAIGVYVRSHATVTVHNVADGTYTIYFTVGSGFSVCHGRFTSGASYWKVKNRLPFVAPPDYTIATLTLFAVNGGGSPTSQISPSSFPPP